MPAAPATELAARLAHALRRLEAMRDAAARLMARDQLGRDVFPRGAPELRRDCAQSDTLDDLVLGFLRVHPLRHPRRRL